MSFCLARSTPELLGLSFQNQTLHYVHTLPESIRPKSIRPKSNIQIKDVFCLLALLGSPMHFSRIKGRSLARSASGTISKGAQVALLLCGLLGIASVLLVSSATMAIPNATASNQDDRSGGQVNRKVPAGMVWIASGTFMMGTNDERCFPNERPAHLR